MDRTEFKSQQHIRDALAKGEDVFGRPNFFIRYIDIDETFPVYIREKAEELQHLIINKEESTVIPS